MFTDAILRTVVKMTKYSDMYIVWYSQYAKCRKKTERIL